MAHVILSLGLVPSTIKNEGQFYDSCGHTVPWKIEVRGIKGNTEAVKNHKWNTGKWESRRDSEASNSIWNVTAGDSW